MAQILGPTAEEEARCVEIFANDFSYTFLQVELLDKEPRWTTGSGPHELEALPVSFAAAS